MRTGCLIVAGLVAVSACGPSGRGSRKTDASESGFRRAGLWRQTLMRDGRPGPLGSVRLCVDDAIDTRMTMIGHAIGGARCTRSVSKQADGSIRFRSICGFGRGGVVDSTGSAWSDFSSAYHLHAYSVVRGSIYRPMNGSHVIDIKAQYVGPCPSDMTPGEIILGPGLKVNLDRLPLVGAAAAFG